MKSGKKARAAPSTLNDSSVLSALVREFQQRAIIDEQYTALTIARHLSDHIRYDRERKRWHKWVGTHWSGEIGHEVLQAIYEACRVAAMNGNNASLSPPERKRVLSAKFAHAVEGLMRTNVALSVPSDLWDADPWMLGTPGGTIDLRTGKIRTPIPEDYISRLTLVTPAPKGTKAPRWRDFLNQVTEGDKGKQRLLQQWAGIGATGTISEQRFVFLHGPGGNGKGVFLRVLLRLLGPYAVSADPRLFIAKSQETHPTALARLQGARMVVGVEVPKGRAWDSELQKMLTGGDEIVARFMHKDFITFRPRCTITISGNDRPSLDAVDNAIRRRFLLVGFPMVLKVEDQIGDLEEKLIAAEGPAILRWMLDGVLDWRRNGLVVPPSVRLETDAYFKDQDLVALFVEEECVINPSIAHTASKDLWQAWTEFNQRLKTNPGHRSAFGAQLLKIPGVNKDDTMYGRGYSGIGLKGAEKLKI
jgi:putative DNA primase/helicase